MRRPIRPAVAPVLLSLLFAPGATAQSTAAPPPTAAPSAGSALGVPAVSASPLDSREVKSTILRGTGVTPPLLPPRAVQVLPSGDISLNFPGVPASAVAKAVLGDILGLPFAVDPSVNAPVTVVTPHPIRRVDVLGFLEQALASSNLVLANRAGSYTILQSATARGQAPVLGPSDEGYGNETIALRFVNAEEMRKLIDPLVPGAVSVSDPGRNVLIVTGNSTQRRALRDLVAQFDVDWLKGMSFALFVPQRTDARLIAPELEKLLNGPGAPTAGLVRLIAMNQLNGILAIASQPQSLEDVRRFVEVLDREGEGAQKAVFVYTVQNGRAVDLAKVLNSTFGTGAGGGGGGSSGSDAPELNDRVAGSPPAAGLAVPASLTSAGGSPLGSPGGLGATGGVGRSGGVGLGASGLGGVSGPSGDATQPGGGVSMTITADETNNAIVVYATPRNYALIEDALRKLDLPPLQVMIDATISEVTLNHTLQYGLQWAFQSGLTNGALTQGTTNAPVQNFPGLSFLYTGANVTATFNALRSITDVKTLSAPKLMVLNNHTATIQVGAQVPISTGSATSTVGTGGAVVNSVDYRDTGVILKITPRVNASGLVLLDIAQEVSNAVPITTASVAAGGIASPTINQRKIATSVAVQDGVTLALGGLISNEVDKGRSTIPLLGDIPILGHLFGDTTGTLLRTELVVLLTPRVVRTPVDAAAVTAELREKIHLAAPLGLPARPAGAYAP